MIHRVAVPSLLIALTLPVGAQTLDDIRDRIRDALETDRYTSLITAFVDLSEEEVLSAAEFRVDGDPDLEFGTIKIPFEHTFPAPAGEPALYLEGNLGYLRAEAEFPDLYLGALPGLETRAESEWTAFSALTGIGISVPLGPEVTLTPIVDLAIAHIENEVDYSGRGSAVSAAILDGLLFEWDATIFSYGGALQLDIEHPLGARVRAESRIRYDLRRSEGIESTDPAQDASDTSQRVVARVDLRGPIGIHLGRRKLGWHLIGGFVGFVGDTDDAIGFGEYFEVGGGLALEIGDSLPVVSSLEFQVSFIHGDDVRGLSFGLGAEF